MEFSFIFLLYSIIFYFINVTEARSNFVCVGRKVLMYIYYNLKKIGFLDSETRSFNNRNLGTYQGKRLKRI